MNNKVTRNGIHRKNYIRSVSVDGRRQRNLITKRETIRKRKMVQAWYDAGFALAWSEYQARGPPDTARGEHLAQHNGQSGWGGRTYTKEEAEELSRSNEAIRDRALLARAADYHARAEKKRQRLAGTKPVNPRTRCGGNTYIPGECSHPYAPSYVIDGHPPMSGPYYKSGDPLDLSDWHNQDRLRYQLEQNAQGSSIDESAQLQLYKRLERAAGRHPLEFEVPRNSFHRPVPHGWEACSTSILYAPNRCPPDGVIARRRWRSSTPPSADCPGAAVPLPSLMRDGWTPRPWPGKI